MIQISLSARGRLHLHFPDGHAVSIPFNTQGMLALKAVLMAQQRWPRAKIGTTAVPTQWDVDKWLKDHAPGTLTLDIQLDL